MNIQILLKTHHVSIIVFSLQCYLYKQRVFSKHINPNAEFLNVKYLVIIYTTNLQHIMFRYTSKTETRIMQVMSLRFRYCGAQCPAVWCIIKVASKYVASFLLYKWMQQFSSKYLCLSSLSTKTAQGRNSSVGVMTRCGLESQGIGSRWGRHFPHSSSPVLGPTQFPLQLVPGLFHGGKQAGAWL